jgi:hypothetical protein
MAKEKPTTSEAAKTIQGFGLVFFGVVVVALAGVGYKFFEVDGVAAFFIALLLAGPLIGGGVSKISQ